MSGRSEGEEGSPRNRTAGAPTSQLWPMRTEPMSAAEATAAPTAAMRHRQRGDLTRGRIWITSPPGRGSMVTRGSTRRDADPGGPVCRFDKARLYDPGPAESARARREPGQRRDRAWQKREKSRRKPFGNPERAGAWRRKATAAKASRSRKTGSARGKSAARKSARRPRTAEAQGGAPEGRGRGAKKAPSRASALHTGDGFRRKAASSARVACGPETLRASRASGGRRGLRGGKLEGGGALSRRARERCPAAPRTGGGRGGAGGRGRIR